MAVPGTPLKTTSRWCSLGPVTIFEPFSAGNIGGMPWPSAWWQAAQMVW